MRTFMKVATRSFRRVTGLVMGLSLAAGLFFIPGSRVHAETEALSAGSVQTEDVSSAESDSVIESVETAVVTEAASKTEAGVVVESDTQLTEENASVSTDVEVEIEGASSKSTIKKSLESKISEAAGKLYSGITYITLNDCGKRVAGFVNAFSNGYAEFQKKQAEKEAAKSRASKAASEREYSEVLTYKYNPDMDISITDKEYEVLCRIVEAEAGDQDVYGRILVVNVILNRVNCKKEFANDIEGVVFEKGQFSPISNGAYYRVEVDDITREAVQRAVTGEDYSQGALFFIQRSSASKSGAAWFDTLTFLFKYGCHEFYGY